MYLLPLLSFLLPAADAPTPAKTEPALVLELLVKAYNRKDGKEFYPLLDKDYQKRTPAERLDMILRSANLKYGPLDGPLPRPREDQGWQVYRVRGHQPFALRVRFNDQGQLAGLQFRPAFLDDLPSGPLFLEEVQGRLRDAVEQSMRAYQVPSISLALVKGDRVVWMAAFGQMNRARAVAADSETAYVTGSIFKVVVATAIMQLVDEGKLDLDAPVNRYIKGSEIPNPFDKEVPLTVRHLLSHHGGVPNGAQIIDLWERRLPTSVEDIVKKKVKVTTKPGTKFQYSNYAYTFNGWLLGKITGSSFDAAMGQRILGPLDMKHTVFEPTPALCENLAIPYQRALLGKSLSPTARTRLDCYPAGDVYSTPTDMAHFLIMHLNGGKYAGKQVLSSRSVAEMARPQFGKKDERSPVGLGWMLDGDGEHRILWHNGAVPGFYTQMGIQPSKGTGVVLFCNAVNNVAVAVGLHPDPLVDLRMLALELLGRLDATSLSPAR